MRFFFTSPSASTPVMLFPLARRWQSIKFGRHIWEGGPPPWEPRPRTFDGGPEDPPPFDRYLWRSFLFLFRSPEGTSFDATRCRAIRGHVVKWVCDGHASRWIVRLLCLHWQCVPKCRGRPIVCPQECTPQRPTSVIINGDPPLSLYGRTLSRSDDQSTSLQGASTALHENGPNQRDIIHEGLHVPHVV